MKEQKFFQMIVTSGKFLEATDHSTAIKDIFAEGWTVREMATPGPDGLVLLLMERNKPAAGAGWAKSI